MSAGRREDRRGLKSCVVGLKEGAKTGDECRFRLQVEMEGS